MKGEAISEYSLVEILRRFAPFAAAIDSPKSNQ
jgi:hypothetical protein